MWSHFCHCITMPSSLIYEYLISIPSSLCDWIYFVLYYGKNSSGLFVGNFSKMKLNCLRCSINKCFMLNFSDELVDKSGSQATHMPNRLGFQDLHCMEHKTKCMSAPQPHHTAWLVPSSILTQILYYCWHHSQPKSWLWPILCFDWIWSSFFPKPKPRFQ